MQLLFVKVYVIYICVYLCIIVLSVIASYVYVTVCMYICVCIRDHCGWSIKIDLWFLQRNSLPVAGEDVFLSITETSVGLVGNQ
jgi:hypothetical protein